MRQRRWKSGGSEGKQTSTSIPHSEECSLPDLSCQLFHRAFSSPGRHLSKLLYPKPCNTIQGYIFCYIFPPQDFFFLFHKFMSQHSSQALNLFPLHWMQLDSSKHWRLTKSYTVGPCRATLYGSEHPWIRSLVLPHPLNWIHIAQCLLNTQTYNVRVHDTVYSILY